MGSIPVAGAIKIRSTISVDLIFIVLAGIDTLCEPWRSRIGVESQPHRLVSRPCRVRLIPVAVSLVVDSFGFPTARRTHSTSVSEVELGIAARIHFCYKRSALKLI